MDLGRPSGLCRVRAGDALLYVTHDADLASTIKERQLAPDIFLSVTDIDSVYAQHRAAKADIAEELTMRPWGVRQYVVREPNGYLLKVADRRKKKKQQQKNPLQNSSPPRSLCILAPQCFVGIRATRPVRHV